MTFEIYFLIRFITKMNDNNSERKKLKECVLNFKSIKGFSLSRKKYDEGKFHSPHSVSDYEVKIRHL